MIRVMLGGDQAGGETGGIAALAHLRYAHAADGRTGRRAGTAHGGEYRTTGDVGDTESTGQLVEPAVHGFIQIHGGARLADGRPHEDEQRNRQQGEIVELAKQRQSKATPPRA
jgi:hypothetical protein